MSSFLISTNQNFNTLDDILISIAKATVASFKLEGITISFDEAYQMALKAAEKRINKPIKSS